MIRRLLVPIAAMVIVAGCGGSTPQEGEPIYSQEEHGIHFDGLFVDHMQETSVFLRFFADGTVLRLEGIGRAEEVAQHMKRGYREISTGKYALDGGKITFTVTGRSGNFDYEGKLGRDEIEMEVLRHGTDTWDFRTYRFREVELP